MANTDISLEPLFNERFRLLAIEGYYAAYRISGATSYFAFENKEGAWYIMREVNVAGEVTTTYAKGSSDIATAWANRVAGVTYASFSNTF